MGTPEQTRKAEEMADAFFDWAKAQGILRTLIEDPAAAFAIGASTAFAWLSSTPEGRPWLHMLEREVEAAKAAAEGGQQ